MALSLPLKVVWWINSLSITLSMIAVVFASYAVVDLGVKHQAFKFANASAALFILVAAALVGFKSTEPAFLLAASIGLGWIAVMLYLCLAKFLIESFVKR